MQLFYYDNAMFPISVVILTEMTHSLLITKNPHPVMTTD